MRMRKAHATIICVARGGASFNTIDAVTEVSAKVAEPATAVPPTESSARRRRGWLIEIAWAVGTGAVAMLLAAVFLQVWDGSRHIPMYKRGDANFSLLLVKTLMSNGWVGVDHLLGFPFGSALYDDAVVYGDSSQLLIMKILSLGTSDPVVVMNVFFMGTFFLVGMSAYAVLRDFAFPRLACAVPAILYSLLPYHFFRSESHLFLAAYYAVPLGAWIILRALRGDPLWTRRAAGGHRLTQWASGRSLATLAACVIVGTSEIYYAAFTLLLIVPLSLLSAGASRAVKRLLGPLVAVVAIVGSTLVVQLPAIVWHAQHGVNQDVTKRLPTESQRFALDLASLVVPLPGHPIAGISNLGDRYYSNLDADPAENVGAALGSWLTLGFVAVVLAAFFAAFGAAYVGRARLMVDAGLAAGVAFLYGTTGAGGTLFGFYVSTQLRGWNRISIFIAFFAAIGLAALLGWLLERGVSRRGQVLGVVALGLVLFTGYKDQTRTGFRPTYAENLATWRNDSRFVSGIEARLPGSAAILQYPQASFPEFGPVFKIEDYDELKGYLHSDRLRWSYGAIKGREPDDWASQMKNLSLDQQIASAVAAGFRGVTVDTFGYEDGGADFLRRLTRDVGAPPDLVSENGRLVFFDLTALAQKAAALPAATRVQAAEALLRPIAVDYGTGFYGTEQNGDHTWHWGQAKATLELHNETSLARRLTLRFTLRTPGTTTQRVVLGLPGGRSTTIAVRARRPKSVRLSLVVSPGDQELAVTTDAPVNAADGRQLHVQVLDLERDDAALSRLQETLDR
jgi:phosphoglycerol transferase